LGSHWKAGQQASSKKEKVNPNGVRFGLLNSRSINNKENLIFELILDYDLDFLAITETWCSKDSSVSLSMISPPGFSVLHTPRDGRGGGLALVFKDIFKVKLNKVKSYTTFEYQLVSVSFGYVNLKVALFYKPSGVYDDLFHAQFND
jgi:hypothetical protein